MIVRAKPTGGPFERGNRRATQLGQCAGLLLSLGLSLVATACGATIDGDQWVEVKVTNTTSKPAMLDTHPSRYLSPGQKTVLTLNSNNNPQAVRVKDAEGRELGCLTFRTTPPAIHAASLGDVTVCDENVRPFPG